eukprot:657393-Rhodomonas_salina.2
MHAVPCTTNEATKCLVWLLLCTMCSRCWVAGPATVYRKTPCHPARATGSCQWQWRGRSKRMCRRRRLPLCAGTNALPRIGQWQARHPSSGRPAVPPQTATGPPWSAPNTAHMRIRRRLCTCCRGPWCTRTHSSGRCTARLPNPRPQTRTGHTAPHFQSRCSRQPALRPTTGAIVIHPRTPTPRCPHAEHQPKQRDLGRLRSTLGERQCLLLIERSPTSRSSACNVRVQWHRSNCCQWRRCQWRRLQQAPSTCPQRRRHRRSEGRCACCRWNYAVLHCRAERPTASPSRKAEAQRTAPHRLPVSSAGALWPTSGGYTRLPTGVPCLTVHQRAGAQSMRPPRQPGPWPAASPPSSAPRRACRPTGSRHPRPAHR